MELLSDNTQRLEIWELFLEQICTLEGVIEFQTHIWMAL